jgi:2-methylcitrate dehydratase PrpD
MRAKATAASTLADYASALRFEDIPAAVLRRAKDRAIDTVGTVVYGNAAPADASSFTWPSSVARSLSASPPLL